MQTVKNCLKIFMRSNPIFNNTASGFRHTIYITKFTSHTYPNMKDSQGKKTKKKHADIPAENNGQLLTGHTLYTMSGLHKVMVMQTGQCLCHWFTLKAFHFWKTKVSKNLLFSGIIWHNKEQPQAMKDEKLYKNLLCFAVGNYFYCVQREVTLWLQFVLIN